MFKVTEFLNIASVHASQKKTILVELCYGKLMNELELC